MLDVSFKWEAAPADVFPQGFENYSKSLYAMAEWLAEAQAEEATAWMQQNAPWMDVSGRARAGLAVDVEQAEGMLAQLIFHHGADVAYGMALELANQGRFAIIAPAIDYFGPKFMNELRSWLS